MNLQENPKEEAFISHASSFISPGCSPICVTDADSEQLLLHLLPVLSLSLSLIHTARLEKTRIWSSLEVTQLIFSIFLYYHSYCGQFKERTQINTLSC